MRTKLIDFATAALRNLRRFRNRIRLRLTGLHLLVGVTVQNLVELLGIEAQERQVEVRVLQVLDLERESSS